MSNKFRKNAPVNIPDKEAKKFIDMAEDVKNEINSSARVFSKKEITFPLSAKHSGLLEKIYDFHDSDISRRKIGAKALAFGIESEALRLGISISDSEYK
jgi:hypothetical protein